MTKIEAIWRTAQEQAGERPLDKGTYRLIRLDADYSFDIFAGIDSDKFVLLALGVQARPPSIDVGSSALDYFRQKREGHSWLMVLRLQRAGLEQVFGRLCQDLVDAAVQVHDESALVDLFCERLELWRNLFQRSSSGLLEKNQIKGLIAELLTLEMLLECTREDAMSIATGWVGPQGAKQDFIFRERAIEVKAISPDSTEIWISSVDQLDSIAPLELHVYELRDGFANEDQSTNLVELVVRIEGKLSHNARALQVFRDRLLAAQYVENEYYETVNFVLQARTKYRVAGTFPKLVRSLVPAEIGEVSYSIRLSGIWQFVENWS